MTDGKFADLTKTRVQSLLCEENNKFRPPSYRPDPEIEPRRLKVERALGAGSNGCVFSAVNLNTHEIFAVKFALIDPNGERNQRPTHVEEAVYLKCIAQSHKYITEFEGSALNSWGHVLFYEACDGGDLEAMTQLFRDNGEVIPEGFLWHAFEQICEGIAWLHDQLPDSSTLPAIPLETGLSSSRRWQNKILAIKNFRTSQKRIARKRHGKSAGLPEAEDPQKPKKPVRRSQRQIARRTGGRPAGPPQGEEAKVSREPEAIHRAEDTEANPIGSGRRLAVENFRRTRRKLARQKRGLSGTIDAKVEEKNRKPILHNDLKPGNIFLKWERGDYARMRYPTIKIGDMGGAALLDEGEWIGGTAQYTAPEWPRVSVSFSLLELD